MVMSSPKNTFYSRRKATDFPIPLYDMAINMSNLCQEKLIRNPDEALRSHQQINLKSCHSSKPAQTLQIQSIQLSLSSWLSGDMKSRTVNENNSISHNKIISAIS